MMCLRKKWIVYLLLNFLFFLNKISFATELNLSEDKRSLCYLHLNLEQKAVTLLAHGINSNPVKLRELADSLFDLGHTPILLALEGHHPAAEKLDDITASDWLQQARQCALSGSELARKHGVPFYFVGYSLGALIGAYLEVEQQVHFERMVLFAPAIETKYYTHLIRYVWDDLPIFGLSDGGYNYHTPYIPAKAFKNVFAIQDQFHDSLKSKVFPNIPVKVFVHPKDLLIDVNGLKQFKNMHKLDMWTIQELSNIDGQGVDTASKYKHLVIDSKSLGTKIWQLVSKAIAEFFI